MACRKIESTDWQLSYLSCLNSDDSCQPVWLRLNYCKSSTLLGSLFDLNHFRPTGDVNVDRVAGVRVHGMNLERDLAGLFVEKDSAVSDDTVGFRV